MSSVESLAAGVESSVDFLLRYVEGFDDESATAQTPGLPNHVHWCLGHLALTVHRTAERIGGEKVPLTWDPEPFAFGSDPAETVGVVDPPLATMIDRFQAAMRFLGTAIRAAGEDGLAREVPWGNSTIPARDLAIRMVFHNGLHCGQIVDLRRALDVPPLFPRN